MNDAELVKSRLDILDVIEGYVELKKAGKDYKGLSPFRQERTASFYVSPEKQIWHDFGANEGGDMISFVMQIEGLSFSEALQLLADRAGVKLQKTPRVADGNKVRLFAASDRAMRYYHLKLSQSPPALQYLKEKRGLTAKTIKQFTVGYAPDGWTQLADYLIESGFVASELTRAGLCGQRTDGRLYDLFRDRVVFPVFDVQGRPIGFSGRILQDKDNTAKYINTPDSPIYHKGQAIFGYHQAKLAIRAAKTVIVVEGHLDVLSLSQHGQDNVVALSGTALAFDQLKQLSRTADTIQLSFDQDSAGQKATIRALELAAPLDTRMEVVVFSGAKDPDELIRSKPKVWQEALESAVYGWDYLVDQARTGYDLSQGGGRKQFVRTVLPYLRLMNDRVEQENYLIQIAAQAGVESTVIRELMTQPARSSRRTATELKSSPEPQASKPPTQTRAAQLEQLLLEMVVTYPETRVVLGDLSLDGVSDDNRPLFAAIRDRPTATLEQIGKVLPDKAEYVKVLSLRGDHEYSAMTEHERGLEAFTQVHAVQKHITSLKKRALTRAIAAAEQSGDIEQAADLLKNYQQLVNDEALY